MAKHLRHSRTKDEANRLVADIAQAIQTSEILSLLRRKDISSPPHTINQEKTSKKHRRNQRKNKNQQQKQQLLPKSLSEIPNEILHERVQPIRKALEDIDAEKLLDLEIIQDPHLSQKQAPSGSRVRNGVYCRPIYDKILPELQGVAVRYLHIAEVPDQYTIGVFVFGPHERIPLHDHPEMCVLSRVLYGDLERVCLDLDRGVVRAKRATKRPSSSSSSSSSSSMSSSPIINDGQNGALSLRHMLEQQIAPEPEEEETASWWVSRGANWLRGSNNSSSSSSSNNSNNNNNTNNNKGSGGQRFPEGTKIAYWNSAKVLAAPEVDTLYPYEGNLHEFQSGPYGAAILDVLLPPYDENERDCTFFNIQEVPMNASGTTPEPTTPSVASSRSWLKRQQFKSTSTNRHDHREPCLIIPTGLPENFHCVSGRYRDLGETDNYDYYED